MVKPVDLKTPNVIRVLDMLNEIIKKLFRIRKRKKCGTIKGQLLVGKVSLRTYERCAYVVLSTVVAGFMTAFWPTSSKFHP